MKKGPATPTQNAIKQKALRMLSTAVGIINPYDKESICELIFRLQLFLPESIIQKCHYNSSYLISFFHEQQQHFINIDDLKILISGSKANKHVMVSRQEFSTQLFVRKTLLIKRGIELGIFFLVPRPYDLNAGDFLLLTEFPRRDNDWLFSIEIFSLKIATEVTSEI